MAKTSPVNLFSTIFLSGVSIAIILVLLGWIFVPAENPTGVIAAAMILVAYGLIARFSLPGLYKNAPEILRTAIRFGVLAGLIFAGEVVLEYILLPKNNTTWGLVEFGSVFFLYFLASLFTAYQTGSIRNGMFSTIVTAMIATLIWTIAVLSMFYAFRGTLQQAQVFQTEGNFADFAQSGGTDFNVFIMEDFMGAVFFHSLLTLLVSTLLGSVGGTIGSVAAKIRSRRSSNTVKPSDHIR